MMLDDASALAAAEQLVQQLAKDQQQQQQQGDAGAADAMQVDAPGECCVAWCMFERNLAITRIQCMRA
jgi:hypothetical protein